MIAAFGDDPTKSDLDRDGVIDWVTRAGGSFPANQIVGGVWNAARARSSAALAAYRPTISRDRQPASRIRSCSWPPEASQVWA